MIIVVEGRMGSGKTLTTTAFAVLDYLENDRRIISNYHLFGVPFTLLTYELFVQWMKDEIELKNTTVILDEAYLYMDSRLSQSSFSRLMSYFALQTRKRDVDLYITTQQFRNVDYRLRANADIRAVCRFNKRRQICTVRLIDLRSGLRRKVRFNGPEFFPFYDTMEIPPLRPQHLESVKL